jgi:hypothetical protein
MDSYELAVDDARVILFQIPPSVRGKFFCRQASANISGCIKNYAVKSLYHGR